MDRQDLQELKKTVADGVREGFSELWEGNLEPSFNTVYERLDKVDSRLSKVESDVLALDGKVVQLPTKSYLDDKVANLEGGLITKLRKEDEKINRLAEMLKDKEVLSDSDIQELQQLEIFPKEPK